MSRGNRRLPTSYIEEVLPSIDRMIGRTGPADKPEERATSRAEGNRMRKVHFYIDAEDYEKIEEIVSRLSEGQGVLGDRRGLFSKVLRMSVKLGLSELEGRVARG